jgi:hypothetical protein
MLVRLSVLLDAKGREISKSLPLTVSLDMDRSGRAICLDAGDHLTHELHSARVIEIARDGFRITGMEPGPGRTYRLQEWWCRPVEAKP